MKHISTKTCTKCHTAKPVTEFYDRSAQCKECIKARVYAYRAENIDRVREYDRNRPNAHERAVKNTRRNKMLYAKNDEFKQSVLRSSAKWRENNALKRKAHIIVGNAIKYGKLKKLPCEVCRSTDGVHAHHEDYRFPLDVRWLCVDHHGARHRQINEAIRSGEVWSHKGF